MAMNKTFPVPLLYHRTAHLEHTNNMSNTSCGFFAFFALALFILSFRVIPHASFSLTALAPNSSDRKPPRYGGSFLDRSSARWSTSPGSTETHTSTTKASSNVTSNSYRIDTVTPLVGGDYAGLSATFDAHGKLIPIQEHWIPESLLEWGQAPWCLEVLVSEDVDATTRQTVTILPETGCAVDNLETIKK